MTMQVAIDVLNPREDSIYCVLKRKLGREPTNDELKAEVLRILNDMGD
jgi:hypothetical protein